MSLSSTLCRPPFLCALAQPAVPFTLTRDPPLLLVFQAFPPSRFNGFRTLVPSLTHFLRSKDERMDEQAAWAAGPGGGVPFPLCRAN